MNAPIEFTANFDCPHLGQDLYTLIEELYPICRSITGNGLRETLRIIEPFAQLEIHEIPTGTTAYDWAVPKEWNITDAYIMDSEGNRVVDFQKSNLHVVGYSVPVQKKISREDLLPHLHTIPEHPDWIPYRYSYHEETWGFCLSHHDLENLNEPEYQVSISSSLAKGHLTYGEAFLPGSSSEEILISAHACHPSLCNDNLSGLAIAALLAQHINTLQHRYSYRFLFLPCTIGPIAWLSKNEEQLSRIKHGLVLACLGDAGHSTYLQSRKGTANIDRAFAQVLRQSGSPHDIKAFEPYGYDQRQYCSPGIDLPVGCIMRTPNGCYPEYHSSADGLSLVQPAYLADSFSKIRSTFFLLENDHKYINLSPKGEPHLGRRGLFSKAAELGLLWVLNYSDGEHSLLDIAEISGMHFDRLKEGADALEKVGLLKCVP